MVTGCTSWAYVAAVLLLTGVSTATAKYSGGTGEPNDPYQIATAADLIALGETPEDYDKHFILTADIDLDPNLPGRRVFDKAVIAPDTNDVADDLQGTAFSGVFDGNGHTISHLTITGASCLGLFGQLHGLYGDEENRGGWPEVRALGVVDVNVTGSGSCIGGLVGVNGGNVSQCYSTGTVSGIGEWSQYVGGLVGANAGTVTWCYSTGAVSGTDEVGGLVGSDGGFLTQCYSAGAVSGPGDVGGLVSRSQLGGGPVTFLFRLAGVTACFWDTETSGQGGGKTTSEMHDIRTYQDAGWDFVGEVKDGLHEIWQMPQGGGYPVLAVFNGYTPPQLQGSGAADDPYVISDALELGAIVSYRAGAHYRLAAPIDLSGIHWSMAVIPWFAGAFDGNRHMISHLTITGNGYLGLFGQLASGAQVNNLGVVDVNVTSSCIYVGGLAGYNSGTLSQCYSTGAISGEWSVGGLAGYNGGTVSQCYSTGAISATLSFGGLVGLNSGSVTWCYSTGEVSPRHVRGDSVGGLVGANSGTGTVTACFWDTQTSGQATSAGGTGKTTAEMQTAKTFLDAGWDFVGETANGMEDIWKIAEGLDYPRLWWETTEE